MIYIHLLVSSLLSFRLISFFYQRTAS